MKTGGGRQPLPPPSPPAAAPPPCGRAAAALRRLPQHHPFHRGATQTLTTETTTTHHYRSKHFSRSLNGRTPLLRKCFFLASRWRPKTYSNSRICNTKYFLSNQWSRQTMHNNNVTQQTGVAGRGHQATCDSSFRESATFVSLS